MLREGQGDSAITVPPSTYTLLAYDLEENALPSENVAFISSEKITVEKGKRVWCIYIQLLMIEIVVFISKKCAYILFSLQ